MLSARKEMFLNYRVPIQGLTVQSIHRAIYQVKKLITRHVTKFGRNRVKAPQIGFFSERFDQFLTQTSLKIFKQYKLKPSFSIKG